MVATQIGTNKKDTLIGTSEIDFIFGLDGNDRISGRKSNDRWVRPQFDTTTRQQENHIG